MVREILFKAKRKDTGEWVEGLLTVMWGQYHIINPNDENTAYPIEQDTICQYTGLTDKNGNKIWENDVVVLEIKRYKTTCKVAWADVVAQFQLWQLDTVPKTSSSLNLGNYDCEVIGNIFDMGKEDFENGC